MSPSPYSRACFRIQFTYLVGGAMVERLRTLTVEPATASSRWRPVEHLKVLSLWSSASGPYGRAPKGPLLSMAALTVEHLKVLMVEPPNGSSPLWSSPLTGLMVEPASASLTVEPAYASLWSSPLTGLMVEPASASLTVEPAFASLGENGFRYHFFIYAISVSAKP